MNNKNIAVIGAGAIGGTTAAFIAKAGYNIQIVCKHDEIVQKAHNGLKIVGVKGDHNIKINAVKNIEDIKGTMDYIIVTTKAYDMPDACTKALKFAHDKTLFVSMQNGISIDAMADVVGYDRTVGCVVGYGATMLEKGKLDMTSSGEFIIGMPNNKIDLSELKEILDSVVQTKISKNIVSELYSKLIINACITSLGAVSGLYLGEMLKIKSVREIFIKIMFEAMDVAKKLNMKIPPYGGSLDYYSLTKDRKFLSKLKSHLLISIVGIKYKKLKSSSLQSLELGKLTEIDYFNGYITDKAKSVGLSAPVNSAITQIIKEIENGERKICIENFDDNRILTAMENF